MGVKSQIKLMNHLWVMEIKSAIEYRFNFLVQTFGMVLNDILWIFFWYLLFDKVETINGWTFHSMLFLYALLLTSWGLAFFIFGNLRTLARMIEEGQLDYYITLPKEILSHAAVKLRYSTSGDLFLGIILFLFLIPIFKWPLFVTLAISSALIFLSFSIIVNSITFFVGKFERVSKMTTDLLLTFSSYPFSIYGGISKFILLFVVPAGFASGIPVELLENFNLLWYLITIGVSILILLIAIFVFYLGLKKYESGNVIGGRV